MNEKREAHDYHRGHEWFEAVESKELAAEQDSARYRWQRDH